MLSKYSWSDKLLIKCTQCQEAVQVKNKCMYTEIFADIFYSPLEYFSETNTNCFIFFLTSNPFFQIKQKCVKINQWHKEMSFAWSLISCTRQKINIKISVVCASRYFTQKTYTRSHPIKCKDVWCEWLCSCSVERPVSAAYIQIHNFSLPRQRYLSASA